MPAPEKPSLKISDHKKKLWLGDDTPEGKRRYLMLRKEMRKHVISVKLYDKKDFGADQWQQFTNHLISLKILTPVRAYLTGDPSPDNDQYRAALDKIMIDVLKKMRGSFKRVYGIPPTRGLAIDPGALKVEDDDEDEPEEDENCSSDHTAVPAPATPAPKRSFDCMSPCALYSVSIG